ncbi:MAG TPA: Asp-tRNA(Asn)/Glu-tRNA(Gln) amidotransferase subunit GatA [Nitrososphaerales archaeon]
MARRLLETPVWQIVEKIASQEVSSEEYTAATIDRIGKVEPTIHAYITVLGETTLEKARTVDKQLKRGVKLGKLAGLPIAIKDNICVKGVRATCGSRMLDNFVAPYNATVIEKILGENGLIIGKTNLDEFAMGSSTEHSFYGPTRNPWDISKVPGGSSGGSAASVSALETSLSLGSDTGGSIRSPAGFCSVVGLKPTYGSVSRYGLISYANSLDQIGPLSRDVRSCALLMDCISGHDEKDSTSSISPARDLVKNTSKPISGLKIGVPKEFFQEGVHEAVSKTVWSAIHNLEKLGAEYIEISIPTLKYALAAYYIVAMSEASSNLARYDGLRYGYRTPDGSLDWSSAFSKNRRQGFGAEVRRRVMLGTYALSAGYFDQYYLKAQKIRTLLKRGFESAFKKFNVLIAPSMPILPFKLGEKINDPLSLYMSDIDTVPANLTGIPAISIPGGLYNGLPIGVQIMAPPFREDILFKIGFMIESSVKIDLTIGEFTHV